LIRNEQEGYKPARDLILVLAFDAEFLDAGSSNPMVVEQSS
jgi:hypothetical protein